METNYSSKNLSCLFGLLLAIFSVPISIGVFVLINLLWNISEILLAFVILIFCVFIFFLPYYWWTIRKSTLRMMFASMNSMGLIIALLFSYNGFINIFTQYVGSPVQGVITDRSVHERGKITWRLINYRYSIDGNLFQRTQNMSLEKYQELERVTNIKIKYLPFVPSVSYIDDGEQITTQFSVLVIESMIVLVLVFAIMKREEKNRSPMSEEMY